MQRDKTSLINNIKTHPSSDEIIEQINETETRGQLNYLLTTLKVKTFFAEIFNMNSDDVNLDKVLESIKNNMESEPSTKPGF